MTTKRAYQTVWTWAGLAAVLALLAAGLAGCSVFSTEVARAKADPTLPAVTAEPFVSAEGRIVPADSAWLSFDRPGTVVAILVAEGEAVTQGQVLARLDDRLEDEEALQAALQAAELERLQARQALDDLNRTADLGRGEAWSALASAQAAAVEANERLDTLDTEDYGQEIDDAWVTVQDEQDNLKDAQEEFDKYKNLDADNSNRKNAEDSLTDAQDAYDAALRAHQRLVNDLEAARAAAAEADAAEAEARRRWEARADGPDADQLALAQARLKTAEAQLAAAQAALGGIELTAPYGGTVVDITISTGEAVKAGQALVQVADFSSWFVETTDLTEMEVVRVEPGQSVRLTPDALPELQLAGEVESIARSFTEKSGDILYTVRVRLTGETDPRLRWGMTVNAEFE